MIIIHATLQVNPEREEQFLAEAETLLNATHEEEGNISYELYKHVSRSNVYIMVEEWRDAEAVAGHNASPHFTGFAAKAGEFLTAPLDVKVYNGELFSK
ncbi:MULTISPECIES: putative quinol monooxygenase [Paenibacillus]|uniref:Antibiotic biosynthesis monooxygenase n=2 Tax=Paenibacillus TaxID=44249 RepID=A0ABX7LC32_9BACL|nr:MULTISPECIES: putative quinol monooxygenase [Paenibacillus]QSF45486.1 antibiotic biosynthesis monooxygenase [Paenibacillus tianjinensis]CAH1214316.1 Putative monooxygenase YcnE [Paenibacillus auburnensis]